MECQSRLKSYEYLDFEEFYESFLKVECDRGAVYRADLVFHLLLPRNPGSERRFQRGLALWVLSILWRLVLGKSSRVNRISESRRALQPIAFRFLGTPAHQKSLIPICDEIPRKKKLTYGVGADSPIDAPRAPMSGLSNSLAVLTILESLRALWGSLRFVKKVQQILAQIPIHQERAYPADLLPRMAEAFLREELEFALLARVRCPHRMVFLSYELIPESKAWVRWAQEAGARIFHVMHGQRLPTYQVTMATDLVLFSRLDEEWFRERVPPEVRIWCIGHPRLEMLREQVSSQVALGERRLPRVAFFSQPSEGDYDRDLRKRDWKLLVGLKGRAEVRFRLHPRECRQEAMEDLKDLGLGFVALSDEGLVEDLVWCDAVASSWSTVSMEAAACGRGVFWTCSSPEKYAASQELREAGVGVLIQADSDWDEPMRDWGNEGWSAPVVLSDAALRELGMIGDMDSPWLQRLGLSPEEGTTPQ